VFKPSEPPAALIDFINRYSTFFIVGHKEPDADCVGSQLALSSLLARLSKKTFLCSAGPFKRHEILEYKDQYLTENEQIRARIQAVRDDVPAVIIVDCSSPERTGDIESSYKGLPLAVIDHHAVGNVPDCVRYIDSEAPANVALIFSLFKSFKLPLTRDEAEMLFLGLCTDTGFFRHVDADGAATFELASTLINAGANPKKTFSTINGGKSLASRQLLGLVLFRASAWFDGRLLLSTEKFEETEMYGRENRDSDTLYQLLMSVEGVEAAVVIRQESQENCTVGLRSIDKVNVADIAAVFGGGGHKNAAGFIAKGSIDEIKNLLLSEFTKIFNSVTTP
jgi:phosphoesterase RecJ-like protein